MDEENKVNLPPPQKTRKIVQGAMYVKIRKRLGLPLENRCKTLPRQLLSRCRIRESGKNYGLL